MTISIPGKANPRQVLAFHSIDLKDDGTKVDGYRLRIGAEEVFITEADADKLGRYFIWDEPQPEPPAQIDVNDIGAYDVQEGR